MQYQDLLSLSHQQLQNVTDEFQEQVRISD